MSSAAHVQCPTCAVASSVHHCLTVFSIVEAIKNALPMSLLSTGEVRADNAANIHNLNATFGLAMTCVACTRKPFVSAFGPQKAVGFSSASMVNDHAISKTHGL